MSLLLKVHCCLTIRARRGCDSPGWIIVCLVSSFLQPSQNYLGHPRTEPAFFNSLLRFLASLALILAYSILTQRRQHLKIDYKVYN